nr:protein trm32 [Quercus suber]
MGKRSQRRLVRYEKDQSGCMWGLISIFDFRQGRTTRRLLSDRKRGSRQAVGAGYSKNKFETLTDLDEDNQGTLDGEDSTTVLVTTDACKPSVKKLIEEEMFNEQDLKKGNGNAEVEIKLSKSGHESHINTEHIKTKKCRKKSRDMDKQDLDADKILETECSCNQNSEKQSIDNVGIDEIMEEFCHWIHQKSLSTVKHDQLDEVQVQSNQKHSDFEKLSKTIKEFINQKFINAKHLKENGKNLHSKELIGALEILCSDEELLLKLVQDPNSLLAKHVLNLQDSQVGKGKEPKSLPESNMSELELSGLGQSEELVSRKQQRNFFRRKVKSQERNPLKQNANSETPNRIVILKPGPAGLRNSKTESSLGSSPELVGEKGLTERVGAHFFLAEIKRKLKSAMGKEWHGISTTAVSGNFPHKLQSLRDGETRTDKENARRNSPGKDHFYMERVVRPAVDVKKGDKTGKLKDAEISKEHQIDGYPKQRASNIYIEAKKHLCEMLSIGEEGVDCSSKQTPKTLGRILSLPEYNSTPVGSPARDWEDKFVTAQMRFSACGKTRKVNSNTQSPKGENNASPLGRAAQNLESESSISDSPDDKVQAVNSNPSISDDIFHDNGVEEIVVSADDEISPEGVVKTVEVTESFEEKEVPSSLLESPSDSLINKKNENLEICVVDVPERPSPISVLEPLFPEDDISPTKSISQPVRLPVQPIQIQYEENDSSAANQFNGGKTCLEENELMFEYVKAVLQASGLNWDEFCVKYHTSDQLLDPSLFHEGEFFPNQLCYDQKLLFDCIDEVLQDVCWHHCSFFSWVSFIKPSIKPAPNMKNAIREVWEGIYWHLLPLPLPHTLDQIVRKDMSRMGTWMDLRFDTDAIGVEMGEAILEDLMEDAILSCINENPDSVHPVLPAELEEDGSSINL